MSKSKTKHKPGIHLFKEEDSAKPVNDEIWKDIPTHQGYYQVSNLGRVKSLDRFVKAPKGGLIFKPSVFLALTISRTGYNRVHLCKEGGSKICALHRLVAMAFIPNTENKPCVNHKNGIKTDNTVDNLEWCTNKENNAHRLNVLKYKHSPEVKERIQRACIVSARKLRKSVRCIEDNLTFESLQDAAKHYGVSYSSITLLIKSKSKSRYNKSFTYT